MDTMNSMFERREDIAFRLIAGEALLVPIKGGVGDLGSIFTLNEVGARVWGLLERGRRVDEIARLVCEEFEVEPAKAEQDVARFLETLREKGLVKVAYEGGGAHELP